MQKCSMLLSLLFGSILLVGCAERSSAPPAEETTPATETETTTEMDVMEEDAEVPAE